MNGLKVIEFDNRGDEQVPFGWIEFNDGTRLGFSPKNGNPNPFGLFDGNWGGNTPTHYKVAVAYLKEVMPTVFSDL
jgi:hypothetical protein